MAFTVADLRQACTVVNNVLARNGSKESYECQSRNGYTAVDHYSNGHCVRNIGSGSPKECSAILMNHAFDTVANILDSQSKADTIVA